jgi:hypothetical protein
MGRSRGGLTSKIHAVVDRNGLPVHLALTPGEAHDTAVFGSTQRLASENDAARRSWIRRGLDQGACPPARRVGQHSAETQPQRRDLLQPVSLSRAQCDRTVLQQNHLVGEFGRARTALSGKKVLSAKFGCFAKACHDNGPLARYISKTKVNSADGAFKLLVHIDRRGSPGVGVGTRLWPPQPTEAGYSGVGYQNEVPPPNLNCCTMSYLPFVIGTA